MLQLFKGNFLWKQMQHVFWSQWGSTVWLRVEVSVQSDIQDFYWSHLNALNGWYPWTMWMYMTFTSTSCIYLFRRAVILLSLPRNNSIKSPDEVLPSSTWCQCCYTEYLHVRSVCGRSPCNTLCSWFTLRFKLFMYLELVTNRKELYLTFQR